jgi:sulfatase maturation enzyme AslB (radical SAM superfamily)
MATVPKFRIDVDIHNLLMNSNPSSQAARAERGSWRIPALSSRWRSANGRCRRSTAKMRRWLFPYIRSRVLSGDFHPITAYLFLEYKCNLDCWYCWSYNNKVKGMTEDVARRSIDWLYDHSFTFAPKTDERWTT